MDFLNPARGISWLFFHKQSSKQCCPYCCPFILCSTLRISCWTWHRGKEPQHKQKTKAHFWVVQKCGRISWRIELLSGRRCRISSGLLLQWMQCYLYPVWTHLPWKDWRGFCKWVLGKAVTAFLGWSGWYRWIRCSGNSGSKLSSLDWTGKMRS